MSDTERLDALKLAVKQANAAKRLIEANIRAEIDRETKRIESEWDETLGAVTGKLLQAERELRVHIDATASHPWEGKRVVRYVIAPGEWKYASNPKKVPEYGIVEVRKSTTNFPANINFSLPSIGFAFVRLLKKDGTPSLKFKDLAYGWQLADEVQS